LDRLSGTEVTMPHTVNDWTIHRILEELASGDPVPGGGAAAALAGAAAASLLQMVIALALRRAQPAAQPGLTSLSGRAHALGRRFQDLADEDIAAYRAVADALALPRSTADEKARRSAALQQALIGAAEVPLDTARNAGHTLALAAELAPLCPRVARSDLLTAVHLAHAAAEAALANVDANALSLDESPFRRKLARLRLDLDAAARAQAAGLVRSLEGALGSWLNSPDAGRSA
jgi:formiminotetrahydrofolate cyclodeaminase